MEDLSAHPLRAAVALDLLKVPEDLLALLVGRSVRLPGAVALLAQTAMGAAVHSDAAVAGAVREASPEVPMVVDLGAPTEEVAAFQVATVAVAEAVNKIATVKPRRGSSDPLLLFLRGCDEIISTFSYQRRSPSQR